ncbi:MAG: DUF4258 domain-containing protein, partial [SAR324 cluster bacterium]|nr:DUF4258 domain-containing protein [SAR324 cluster bacterium]
MKHLPDILNRDFSDYHVEYRVHATKRMFQRSILPIDVETILYNGIIIEDYKDDFPLSSLLINGETQNRRPLHLVVGVNEKESKLVIITVYEPDSDKWE